ncbi:MAG: hypothetical protein IPL98_19405 [Saprospiraceae bacterium]|nr:hypothetical protein [Saprospiraceae bacterium]
MFEILIYCWEDIVDLIEENRDTYDYYVNQKQFKSKYDFGVYLNEFSKSHILEPTFFRKIKRYKIEKPYSATYDFNSLAENIWNMPKINIQHLALLSQIIIMPLSNLKSFLKIQAQM